MKLQNGIFAVIVGVLIVATCYLYPRLFAGFSWRLWLIIRRAIVRIRKIAAHRGIQVSVLWTGAVSLNPGSLALWVKTETDIQRDVLRNDTAFAGEVRHVLAVSGYPRDAIESVGLEIQSQETVDRDSGGDWFKAMQ